MNDRDDLDDQVIVAEVVSGQKDLFRLLVNRHQKKVYGMGWSFFRNADDANDFTQEVFLKVYRSLPSFAGRSRFSTWLYAIAYNTAANSVSRRTEYLSLVDQEGEGAVDEATPEHDAIRDAIRTAVRAAVAGLPERYRVCVDLFFFYERSYQEIEAITGYPVNTIKSHVFRAKKLLREQLADFVEGGIV
jgi:RNA polymerase sigma-70 factor (ECF subfamily)